MRNFVISVCHGSGFGLDGQNVLGEKGKAVVQRFGFPEGTIEVILHSLYCKTSIFRKGAIFGIWLISFSEFADVKLLPIL